MVAVEDQAFGSACCVTERARTATRRTELACFLGDCGSVGAIKSFPTTCGESYKWVIKMEIEAGILWIFMNIYRSFNSDL